LDVRFCLTLNCKATLGPALEADGLLCCSSQMFYISGSYAILYVTFLLIILDLGFGVLHNLLLAYRVGRAVPSLLFERD
jgi:hypothetical protein